MLFPEPKTDFTQLNNMIMESVTAKAVMAAAELKIFDLLSGGRLTLADIADKAGLVPERLEPLLGILAAVGLLVRDGEGYANAPIGEEYLVSSSPLYQGDFLALTMGFSASVEQSLLKLLAGGEVNREGTDRGWSEDRAMNGSAQDALRGGARAVADAAASLPGFETFREMCDIGGNHGLYTMAVLDRNPALRGTIFDLPSVVEHSARRCERLGYGSRVRSVGMDFREETLPEARYDLAVASHVLYAFKADLSGALRKIADGLKPGGWFISHHSCGSDGPDKTLPEACLELVTRLAGYASHFIGREELAAALDEAGFEPPDFRSIPGREARLIACARKR